MSWSETAQGDIGRASEGRQWTHSGELSPRTVYSQLNTPSLYKGNSLRRRCLQKQPCSLFVWEFSLTNWTCISICWNIILLLPTGLVRSKCTVVWILTTTKGFVLKAWFPAHCWPWGAYPWGDCGVMVIYFLLCYLTWWVPQGRSQNHSHELNRSSSLCKSMIADLFSILVVV